VYSPVRAAVAAVFHVSPEPPHLPSGTHHEVQVFRAAPSYLRYRLFFWAIGMLFVGLIFGGVIAAILISTWHSLGTSPAEGIAIKIAVTLLASIYLAIVAISYAVVRLDWEFRWYIVTDRSLRIRQGIGTFEETTLTFANVQNAEFLQGPIERLFGFANVLVETAGGGGPVPGSSQAGLSKTGGHRGLIRGLEDASRVRDLIRVAIARHGGAGLGDREDVRRAAPAGASVALAALSPALREVLDETRGLRSALERRGGGA
jgi:membrane protein YdbS with pleckstrin-like domain